MFLTLPKASRSKRPQRLSTFIMTSAAVAYLWQRQVCVSRKTSGRALNDHELSHAEDLERDISLYKRNIYFADNDQLDQIEEPGRFLKKDPVEWTARWEEVIDEADRMTEEKLKNHPRGMGFCHGFWHERQKALRKLGVVWRCPTEMNPGTMFD